MRVRQPAPGNSQHAAATAPQAEIPPSPTSSSSSSEHQKEVKEELCSSQVPKAASTLAGSSTQKSDPTPESTNQSAPTEAEPMQVEAAPPSANENENPPSNETIMEESIRVTRGRLRSRSAGIR